MRKKKKEMQLLPVTGRSAFGWCHASSAQNRPLVHEGESAGKREERKKEKEREKGEHSWEARKRSREKEGHIQSTQYHLGKIFGGL